MKAFPASQALLLWGLASACTSPTEGSIPSAETLSVSVQGIKPAVSTPGVIAYRGISISGEGTRLRIDGTIAFGSTGFAFAGDMVVRGSTIDIVIRASIPPYTIFQNAISVYEFSALSIPIPAGTYRVNAMLLDGYRLRAEADETITIPGG